MSGAISVFAVGIFPLDTKYLVIKLQLAKFKQLVKWVPNCHRRFCGSPDFCVFSALHHLLTFGSVCSTTSPQYSRQTPSARLRFDSRFPCIGALWIPWGVWQESGIVDEMIHLSWLRVIHQCLLIVGGSWRTRRNPRRRHLFHTALIPYTTGLLKTGDTTSGWPQLSVKRQIQACVLMNEGSLSPASLHVQHILSVGVCACMGVWGHLFSHWGEQWNKIRHCPNTFKWGSETMKITLTSLPYSSSQYITC